MTQSFDEWFDKNDVRILVERSTARFVYEAGAQSKQAEIDELQKEIDSYKCIYGKLELERDELRKRIDEAVLALEKKSTGLKGLVDNYNKSLNILKGTTNEQ